MGAYQDYLDRKKRRLGDNTESSRVETTYDTDIYRGRSDPAKNGEWAAREAREAQADTTAAVNAVERYSRLIGENPLESSLPRDPLKSSAKYLYTDAALKKHADIIDAAAGEAGTAAGMRASLAAQQIKPKKENPLESYAPKSPLENAKEALFSSYRTDKNAGLIDKLYGEGAAENLKTLAWQRAVSGNENFRNASNRANIIKEYGSMENYRSALENAYNQTPEAAQERLNKYKKNKARIDEIDSILEERGDTGTTVRFTSSGEVKFGVGHDEGLAKEREVLQDRINEYEIRYKTTDEALLGTVDHPDVDYESYIDPNDPLEKFIAFGKQEEEAKAPVPKYYSDGADELIAERDRISRLAGETPVARDNSRKAQELGRPWVNAPAGKATETDFVVKLADALTWPDPDVIKGQLKNWDQLSENEVNYYRGLRNDDPKAAKEWLNKMSPILNKRAYVEETRRYEEGMEDLPWYFRLPAEVAANAGTTAIKPFADIMAGAGWVYGLVSGDYDPYDEFSIGQLSVDQVRGETENAFNRLFGTEEGFVRAGDIFQNLMSGIDSLYGYALFEEAYTVLMGVGAAAEKTRQMYDDGVRGWKAFAEGTAAGLIEWGTEQASLEVFLSEYIKGKPTSAWDFWKRFAASGAAEGSEEVVGNIMNRSIDNLIMGADSEEQKRIQEYIRQGHSRQTAGLMAFTDDVVEDLKAFMGGFITLLPEVGGAYSGAYRAAESRGQMLNADDSIDDAYGFADDIAKEVRDRKVRKDLEKAAAAAKNNPTNRNAGYLANAIENAEKAVSQQEIAKAVREAGVDASKIDDAIEVLNKVDAGETLSDKENELLKDEKVKAVYDELFGMRDAAEEISRNNRMIDVEKAVTSKERAEQYTVEVGDRTITVPGIGENGREALDLARDQGVNPADAAAAYDAGVKGETFAAPENVSENESRVLRYAYESGRLDAPAPVNSAPGLDKESIKTAGVKYTSKETRTLDAVGKALKTRVEIVRNLTDSRGNPADAEYDKTSATIRISADAKNPVRSLLAHEVVHRIRAVSEDAYQTLVSFVAKNMSQNAKIKALAFRRYQYGLDKSLDYITEEVVGDAFADILDADPDAIRELVEDDRGLGEKIRDAIRDIIIEIDRWLKQRGAEREMLSRMTDAEKRAYREDTETMRKEFSELRNRLVAAESRFVSALKAAQETLEMQNTAASAGMGFDAETDTLFSVRYEPGMNGVRSREEIVKMMVEQGVKEAAAKKFMDDSNGVANQILGYPQYLDFAPDDRYKAIKQNSDYPQGTIDLTNNCPKREGTTVMFDMLQRMFPERMFTAADIVEIKKILEKEGIETACDACFVEDRRQKLGEIAGTFIDMWKTATETGKPLQKTNAKGDKVTMRVTKRIADQYGVTKGALYDTTDGYVPNQYDLVTYEGFAKLQKEHPWIAAAFEAYNNSRGQQSGRFIEGHAEYKREILNWNQKKVDSVNAAGGLRIFSFSDFQPVHMLDIIQVIADCAAKGVKIQGYTKNPLFAQLVRNTGVKLNRSLIPYGATGMKIEKGRKVLAYDTKGGIDINSKDFLDERDNPNVGNILIGINPEQIALAFEDDFVDYVIPFHSNKAKAILQALGIGEWVNYKMTQTEKNLNGETVKNVNIYTQVIDKYAPQNKVDFVNAFLEECRRQKKIPRYAEFLNKEYSEGGTYSDEGGRFNYTYREGYHKLLIDFKMFDRQGNILLQQTVRPDFDPDLMKRILDEEIRRRQEYVFPQKVFDRVKEKFEDNGKRYKLTKPISRSETQKNITEVALMDSVKDLSGEEFKKSDIDLITQVSTYFDNLNNKVNTSYGPIKLEEKGIKSVIGHRLRRNKAIAFAAIPEVLQNGKIIDYQTNWKGRGYNTAVFAAPIKINGVDYYMGCVVNIYPDHNAYYLHDVLLKQNEGTLSFKTGTETGTPSDNVPSVISLLQEINNVNPSDENSKKYSLTVTPEQARRYLELAKDPEANEAELSRMVEAAARAAGFSIKAWHGRGNTFTIFDKNKIGSMYPMSTLGFYFTQSKDIAEEYASNWGTDGNVLSVYLRFKNPLVISDNGWGSASAQADIRRSDLKRWAEEGNHDGIIVTSTDEDDTVYIALDSEQIKSADPVTYDDQGNIIPLEERFNEEKDDIRYSLKKPVERTDNFKRWFGDSKMVNEDGTPKVFYHGTNADFSAFAKDKRGIGYWFTEDKEYANDFGKKVMPVYLKAENPLDLESIDGDNEIAEIKEEVFGDFAVSEDFLFTKQMQDALKEKGYDALSWNHSGAKTVIVFDPTQIKSADPVTYDDEGNAVSLEERFNPENDDLRRSLPKEGYAEFLKKYGRIPEGETPFRDLEVPQRTGKKQNVSQTVRTVLEAEATPDTLVPTIEDLVADGDFSYEAYSDQEALDDAKADIDKKGFSNALTDWAKKIARGQVSKSITAEGWALYNAAATSGDADTALTVLRNMVAHQRSAAQALQATRILKKLSPEAQLYNVQKTVENLIEDVKDRYGKAPDISVDPDLAEDFLNARSDEERADVLEKIYKQIALQLPSRFIDRWNAWRYLAMLGNPRTHIRNIAGNAGFAPVVAVKDLTATAIESAVNFVSGGRLERTKGFLIGKQGKDLLSAAWADYVKGDNKETALGERKYSDAELPMREIEEYRRIFGNTRVKAWNKTGGRALEWARVKNSELLDKEDVIFSRPHYAFALAQYCKAKGISAEQLRSGKGLDAARAYAAKEAQRATYRDTNAFSQLISRIGRFNYGKGNAFTKGAKMLVEGILPFRKTPANILARGVEYSPIGLLKSITWDLGQVIAKDMSGAELIDHLSAGLTGTGLLALGLWLASMGLVRGHGGDDDKEKEFEKLLGYQDYALQLPDGTSVTLDWLAPEALPFFVGVNLYEEMSAGGKDTLSDAFNAIGNVSEPFLEMSCLQSLNDLLDSIGYAKSKGFAALPSILVSSATSYLTQGLPTVLGQAERTAEDKRMTTYTDQKGFVKDLQYTLGKASAKVPGLDYNQIPYIDAWGREETTGNFGTRLVNNFVNPSYVKKIDASETEKELMRVYEETGEGGVFPKRAGQSFTANGEKYELTADQYVRYAQTKGGTAYEVVGRLVGSDAYKDLPDTDKARVIGEAYTYADQTARTTVGAPITESWVSKAVEANRRGIIPDVYILAWETSKNVESIKDANGKTIDNSSSLRTMQTIYNIPGLTDAQRRYLFECFGVGKKVAGYTRKQVDDALKKMGG